MRKCIPVLSLLMMSFVISAQTPTQTENNSPKELGLPGDNLNLYLVLNLFKQSSSIEDFEKQLNDPGSKINNLDLNNDGNIDYLRVVDYGKDDYHTLVIQDPVSGTETQDVAIIDLQKNNGSVVHVQIIGDESLYGKDYIIEPKIETSNAPAQSAASPPPTVINNNYYINPTPESYPNVWSWPCVSYMYGVGYSPWVSPWYWGYYPVWWKPWPHVHYKIYCSHFTAFGWGRYYRTGYVYNRVHFNNYYVSRRVVSKTVQVNITKNVYRGNTYNNTNQTGGNNKGIGGNAGGTDKNNPQKNVSNNNSGNDPNNPAGINKGTPGNWGGIDKNNPQKNTPDNNNGKDPNNPGGINKNTPGNWGGTDKNNPPQKIPGNSGNDPNNSGGNIKNNTGNAGGINKNEQSEKIYKNPHTKLYKSPDKTQNKNSNVNSKPNRPSNNNPANQNNFGKGKGNINTGKKNK